MGIKEWFGHKYKNSQADGPFGDVVAEEFGLGEEGQAAEEQAEKYSRRPGRVQLNILVRPELAMALRFTAKSYKSPIFVAGEHALSWGLVQMNEVASDPKKFKKMSDHLVNNHLLGTEIRDSLDIRELGWNPKKIQRRYYHVSGDSRLLRLLKDCGKAVRITIKELGEFQCSGNTFTLPLVIKMLQQLLFEILNTLERFSGGVKTPASIAKDFPGIRVAPQDSTPSSSSHASESPQQDSNGISGMVGFNVVETEGEFRDLPNKDKEIAEE